jgi:hypothetical protein
VELVAVAAPEAVRAACADHHQPINFENAGPVPAFSFLQSSFKSCRAQISPRKRRGDHTRAKNA